MQQLRPGGRAAPPLRWGASAYDLDGHRMLVFGGGSETSTDYNDLWAMALAPGKEAWAVLKPYGTAPYFRRHAAAAYDEGNHRLVVFGGYNAVKGQYYDETWLVTELTAGDGRWLKHTGLPRPAPRRGTSLVYQSTEDAQGQPVQRMILFGGYSDDSPFGDVWAFDLTPGQERWRKLMPCGTAPCHASRSTCLRARSWSRPRTWTTRCWPAGD